MSICKPYTTTKTTTTLDQVDIELTATQAGHLAIVLGWLHAGRIETAIEECSIVKGQDQKAVANTVHNIFFELADILEENA